MEHGEITFMWKTAESWTGDCPALYRTDGGYYVQVKKVTDPGVRSRLESLGRANDSPLGADEDYGFVPADVIDRIRGLWPHSVRISSGSCLRSPERRSAWSTSANRCPANRQPFSTGSEATGQSRGSGQSGGTGLT